LISLIALLSLLLLLPPALVPAATSAAASAELPVVCGRLLQRALLQ